MEILSVTLNNFKSHSDRHFTFQPGTNAICGENGAGKTSILEAIAWVLFDYSGDYNKDDLIRNGTASAQVRVTFVSTRDGRTYEVQRCTTKSYTLYDPQLNERLPYSRIKEEVLPWLRQHLGVAAGTDLSQLFSSTIGVPQGTFTADFLLTREKRKPIFDKILKVEEYQQTYKHLNDLEKYAKNQVEILEREIAHYDEELQQLEELQQRRLEQQTAISQAQAELLQAEGRLTDLKQEQEALAALATRSHQLETQLEQLAIQLQTQSLQLQRSHNDLAQAESAVAICTAQREAYQAFLSAESALRDLEQQRQAEQVLQKERRQQEAQRSDRQTALAKVTVQLARLSNAHQEIQHLEPLAHHQIELEKTQHLLNQQLQVCLSHRQTLQQQEKRLLQTQTRQTQLAKDITRLRELQLSVDEIPMLEQQQQRLQQHLSRISAASQFEADLQQLFTQSQEAGDRFITQVQHATVVLKDLQQTVPLWASSLEEILTTLQSGTVCQQQFIAALKTILNDLAEQTAVTKLEQQLQTIQASLQSARQHQAQVANLERLLADQAELGQEQTDLQASLVELQTHLAAEPELRQQQATLAADLETLNNPKGRIQLRQEELHQAATVQAEATTLRSALSTLEAAIAHINTQLAAFATLSDQVQTQQSLKDTYRAAYESYMAQRELANTRKQRQQQVEEIAAALQQLEQTTLSATEERDRLQQTFDPTHFQTVQAAYQSANDQKVALGALLPVELKLLAELEQQLSKLEAVSQKRAIAQTALDQKKKTERFIKFARKAYKEAGPRITERYIHSISREADKLLRELLNRPNVSLQWTRDYEIVIQEGAHPRRFVNLSGGEQMCAALAVRLALLKILADIDIAFFDEPTTNMDRMRRDQLAEAIANIKTFRQLFVISHDDTFEKVTENIILVERE
ncbi:SMC family ATPase [Phormidium sp. CLA17]|uniref:AAA family ATPase n=1 Tax=Leptolyngbya sp. Cla-17 TaxID=2803751 RepID=UPI0014911191|nr:SMC family ATPase [Leptolyngbya sp. Cla-17]MBM0741571.1 SMC family ATPase [Leptolyngbya sp. Cla-17]